MLEHRIHAPLLVRRVRVECLLERGQLGAAALWIVLRMEGAEDPEHGAHVVVLRAQPLGAAFVGQRLLVEREDLLLLVSEVLEHRLAERVDAPREVGPKRRVGGLAGRSEELIAAPVMQRERYGIGEHGAPFTSEASAILDAGDPPTLMWIKRLREAGGHAGEVTPPLSLVFDGPLAVLTLARPPVNAIDELWLDRMESALEALEHADAVAVLLLRSSERAFCAGADLALMGSRFASVEGRAQMVGYVRRLQAAYARLERLPQATLAEIGGAALGGGLELALACDLRIAAHDARLGLPEARLGLLPGAGGTQRLTRIAGEALAKRLILRGEIIEGREAAALGLVQWALPGAELAARARSIVAELAALPAPALASCKRCIAVAVRGEDGYEAEVQGTASLLASAETQRRVREFLEKRR